MTTPRLVLPVVLAVCLGLATGAAGGQLATGTVTAQVDLVGPSTVAPGETFTVEVDVTSTRPLYGAQFRLTFDGPTTPEAVARGGFLERDGRSVLIADDLQAGNVSYGETRVGTDTGVDGTGTLATVSLTVAEDATPQELSLELRGVKLVTPAAEPVNTSTENRTVAVVEPSGGNGDGSGGQSRSAPQGEVELASLSLLNTTIATESTVVTRVDLANFDPAEGRIGLRLTANGSVVTERTLTVGASTNRTVYLEHRFAEPGTYALEVNGARAGSVTVVTTATPMSSATATDTPTSPTSPTPPGTAPRTGSDVQGEATAPSKTSPTPSTPTDGDGTGFGLGGAVVALALVALRLTRG